MVVLTRITMETSASLNVRTYVRTRCVMQVQGRVLRVASLNLGKTVTKVDFKDVLSLKRK